jgi:hypothetical protein
VKNDPPLTRFSDFIRQQVRDALRDPLCVSPFGFEADGYFMHRWLAGFERVGFFSRSRGVSAFAGDMSVDVYVPGTESGITPLASQVQPYQWNGKINEYAAEQALCTL